MQLFEIQLDNVYSNLSGHKIMSDIRIKTVPANQRMKYSTNGRGLINFHTEFI